jgi:NAD(P)H dehydrogenase (quinone)
MSIAITGASGQLGRLVVQELKKRTPTGNLVGLVRSPEKAADLGIALRVADYTRPAELVAALDGVDTLLFISSSEIGKRIEQHGNVVTAAKTAGVRRIVYTSLLHADTSSIGLAEEHRRTENAIKASGLDYTILRNGSYTENYTAAIAGALMRGSFIGSMRNGLISSASRQDFAEAAAVVLTTAGHQKVTYELAGDDAYQLADLAREVSVQVGKELPYVDLPAHEYAASLEKAGFPTALAQAIAGWEVSASQGALYDGGRQLSGLIGRPTTPLAATVAAAL